MALSPKIATGCIAGAGCVAPIPFVIKSGCSIPSLSSTWKRWVEPSSPFLHCKGSKTSIDISLAFRDYEKAKEAEKELYLKGIDTNTWKEVDLYKALDDKKGMKWYWQFQIFGNGIVRLTKLGWGGKGSRAGGAAVGETLTCHGNAIEVKGGGERKKWGKSEFVKKISFEFEKDCKEKPGRVECEIKIADTVGLQWSIKFKPKAIFCASS